MADNFSRQVSLDPLRTSIPADDMARLVEHKDGIVGDRINEQLEAVFGFPKLGCGRGKLPRTIGNACFQSLVERQQSGFEGFAFGDIVIDASYP